MTAADGDHHARLRSRAAGSTGPVLTDVIISAFLIVDILAPAKHRN
ncbi:hypothetical protein ACN2WE_30845 [Streptomyces sp. cg28]